MLSWPTSNFSSIKCITTFVACPFPPWSSKAPVYTENFMVVPSGSVNPYNLIPYLCLLFFMYWWEQVGHDIEPLIHLKKKPVWRINIQHSIIEIINDWTYLDVSSGTGSPVCGFLEKCKHLKIIKNLSRLMFAGNICMLKRGSLFQLSWSLLSGIVPICKTIPKNVLISSIVRFFQRVIREFSALPADRNAPVAYSLLSFTILVVQVRCRKFSLGHALKY